MSTKTVQSENETKKVPPWWLVFGAIERERFTQLASESPSPTADGTGRIYEAWSAEYARQMAARAEAGKPGIWAKDILSSLFSALAEETEVGLESELVYVASRIVAWIEDLRQRRGAKA